MLQKACAATLHSIDVCAFADRLFEASGQTRKVRRACLAVIQHTHKQMSHYAKPDALHWPIDLRPPSWQAGILTTIKPRP